MNKIAIQGIKGSYHHQVAIEYFGYKINYVECLNFDKLIDVVCESNKNIGVMAIENSIAGSIISNYALIDNNDLKQQLRWPLSMIKSWHKLCTVLISYSVQLHYPHF